ncbi:MAG TPA: hypothetical protein VMZ90_10040 [Vicinamibacterales bacterium]|nr:hypothetical protein [Vicinamibacterales bacterium]
MMQSSQVIPEPRAWLPRHFAAVAVVCAGMAIAWVDSRPTWDDTGVTALAVMTLAAAGSLARVPAWLSAGLTVGPLLIAELSGGAGVLLAVPFALVGAYAGAFLRRLPPRVS